MSAGNLSVYGEWLVQEANGCTCCGISPHETGCGYEPLVKVEEIIDALRAARYAVVKLPEHQVWDGPEAWWYWRVGDSTVTRKAGELGLCVCGDFACDDLFVDSASPAEFRSLAAALLAAADASEAGA